MYIPRYWKRVFREVEWETVPYEWRKIRDYEIKTMFFDSWGYSDVSQQEAEQKAWERVDILLTSIRNEAYNPSYYRVRVIQEEILENIDGTQSQQAMVTRNRYFSHVLNCAQMMFVDIDIFTDRPELRYSRWKILGDSQMQEKFVHLLPHSNKSPNLVPIESFPEERQTFIEDTLKKINDYLAGDKEAGFLVYETFAGLRLIASHKPFDPQSEECHKIFDALGTDPLYQRLCKSQNCFRARLTPKYWRLCGEDVAVLETLPNLKFRITEEMQGAEQSPSPLANKGISYQEAKYRAACNLEQNKETDNYGFEKDWFIREDFPAWTKQDSEKLRAYDQWVLKYDQLQDNYATCHFIKHLGNPNINPDLKPLIELHDERTKAYRDLPLA